MVEGSCGWPGSRGHRRDAAAARYAAALPCRVADALLGLPATPARTRTVVGSIPPSFPGGTVVVGLVPSGDAGPVVAHVRLVAEVEGLHAGGQLAHLHAGGAVAQRGRVLERRQRAPGAGHAPPQQVGGQVRLGRGGARKPHAVHHAQRPRHGARRAQPAGDEDFGFSSGRVAAIAIAAAARLQLQARHDGLGKVEEEGLAAAGAFRGPLVAEALVGAAAELDKVHGAVLQGGDELARLGRLEAVVLKVRAVELDGDDESVGHPSADLRHDLEQQTPAPRRVTAVRVVPPVRARRQELRQQVAVRRVQVDPVEARRLQVPRPVREAIHHPRNVRRRRGTRAREARAAPLGLCSGPPLAV